MTPEEALNRAERLVRFAGYESPEALSLDNFTEYASFVGQIARDLSRKQKADRPWLKDWAVSWRKLHDDFDTIVRTDPMVLYRPKHQIAYEFHSSPAFVKYFRAGNRTSKTQSGYAEHYFVTTGQHRWRAVPPGNTFIVGLAFSKYAPNVFEKKFLLGEEDNPLSPMFPEGGKWFHHYDTRKYKLTIACPACANAGKGASCPHQKWTISLFSDEGGWEVLQGAQYRLGHFDEHIRKEFYQEAKQRLASVEKSSLLVTGTPLFGLASWENNLAALAEGDPSKNLSDPSDPSSPPYISLHEISQFDAGIVAESVIRRNMQDMTEFEIKARIYGKPSPITDNPVFDQRILEEMYQKCREPKYFDVQPKIEKGQRLELEAIATAEHLEIQDLGQMPANWTGLRAWEEPEEGGQYLIAVDTARGLIDGDASCASVLRLQNRGMRLHLDLVAQYHGWINAFDYGNEVFKLAVWFNDALVVTELTGGFGDAVILRLKQIGYWNIFRDLTSYSQATFAQDARFGVDTNAATKPFMVAALQQFIRDRAVHVPCAATIQELVAYEQQNATKDGRRLVTPRYQGAGGAHDDRTMSLVIGASVAVSHPVFDFAEDVKKKEGGSIEDLSPEWQKIHKELETPDPFDWTGA